MKCYCITNIGLCVHAYVCVCMCVCGIILNFIKFCVNVMAAFSVRYVYHCSPTYNACLVHMAMLYILSF